MSNSHPVVEYGFVTSYSSGASLVTNTVPSQTLISTSTSLPCAGEVVITSNGLITTIELSTLPSATPISQLAAAKTAMSQGGNPVVGGVPCGDVYIGLGFFVHLLLGDCSGRTGHLGWPGGPIIGILPWPFPGGEPGAGEDPGNGGEDPDDPEETTTSSDGQSTTKTESGKQSSAASSTLSSSSAASSTQSSTSKSEYFIIASPSAVQNEIQAELERFDPAKGGTYGPDVGETIVSGGTWIDYQLDTNQSAIIASRTDIILVMQCTTISGFETASGPTTEFTNVPSAVSFSTVSVESTPTSLGKIGSKSRRDHLNLVRDLEAVITPSRTEAFQGADPTLMPEARNVRSKRSGDERSSIAVKDLEKRDPGTRLVRQVRANLGGLTGDKYPSDLAVMSWAPGVQSISEGKVDYIFEETRGEDTWVYIVDSGVAMNNLVSHKQSIQDINHNNFRLTYLCAGVHE